MQRLMARIELEFILTLTCIYLLKKEWKEVFLTLLKDTVNPIENTLSHMMIANQVNVSCIWMQIIYMVGQWVNIFLTVNLNG